MREVNRKIIDIRNPTHRVLKLDEAEAEDYNNLSSSKQRSQTQLPSNTEVEMEGDLAGEDVEIERTKGEDVDVEERGTMSRTTSMHGETEWSEKRDNYEFDASLKKTREQLNMLKTSSILKNNEDYKNASEELRMELENLANPLWDTDELSILEKQYQEIKPLHGEWSDKLWNTIWESRDKYAVSLQELSDYIEEKLSELSETER